MSSSVEVKRILQLEEIAFDNEKVTQGGQCFWDAHAFKGPAFPQPIRFEPRFGRVIVSPQRIFCSPNCCKAYIQDKGGPKAGERCQLVRYLWTRVFDQKMDENEHIFPAPPREILDIFCKGGCGIETFRYGFKNCIIELLDRPLIVNPLATIVETKRISVQRSGNSSKVQKKIPEKTLYPSLTMFMKKSK